MNPRQSYFELLRATNCLAFAINCGFNQPTIDLRLDQLVEAWIRQPISK